MPSLDFIYDITEKLDEEEIDYLVLTMREGRTEDKVDAFFRIRLESEKTFYASIDQIKEIISNRDDDDDSPFKPAKKRKKRKK